MPRRVPTYAPVIRYLRETQGMTRRELGQRLGVPDYYVGYMEEGYRYPRPRQVTQLSQIFGWSPFEIALVADVEIPYPDWPALGDLAGWQRLANEWWAIVDAIQRYTVAKAIFSTPDWLHTLTRREPALGEAVDRYGFVALYGFLRQRWQSLRPHPGRTALPTTLDEALAAVEAPQGSWSVPGPPEEALPPWWRRLTESEKATLAAVADGLLRARAVPQLEDDPT
ncbi:MAG: helix-turn-helix domain-containing protein [Firmicutes bacterium]|nr:helix-turn-helix transcriptional regulator [Alicyclobacillaceae bacterium]MCL6496536.1 helix-turn-helix domain-containing protein [Bacillota bacterium]